MLSEQSSIIQYPTIKMERFGLIPLEFGGGAKYRLIWAPSRHITLTSPDQTITVPMYFGPYAIEPLGSPPTYDGANAWILEGWKAPHELYGGTEEQWNADPQMLNLGPYPRRGDFVRHETLRVNPSDANIEKLISWIEAGGKRRAIENQLHCIEQLEQKMRDKKRVFNDRIQNRMLPWAGQPVVGPGGSKGTKTVENTRSREELGLPDEKVMKAMKFKSPRFEIENAGDPDNTLATVT